MPVVLSRAAAAALMSSVYEDHKDEDGFLYITYSGENTFGSSSIDSSSGRVHNSSGAIGSGSTLATC